MEYNIELHLTRLEQTLATLVSTAKADADRTNHHFSEMERRLVNMEQTIRSLQQELHETRQSMLKSSEGSNRIGGAIA